MAAGVAAGDLTVRFFRGRGVSSRRRFYGLWNVSDDDGYGVDIDRLCMSTKKRRGKSRSSVAVRVDERTKPNRRVLTKFLFFFFLSSFFP